MTSARIQVAEKARTALQGLAEESYGDPEQAKHLLDTVAAATARTELERRNVCDLAWAMIDSETVWKMHKKLACLKYVWTVTVTMEYRALVRLDTDALHELMEQAGAGYDRHLAAKPTRRRSRKSEGQVSQRDAERLLASG